MVDLSSHGATDNIHLGCHSDNPEEFCICKLVRPLPIVFNIGIGMHDTVTELCLCRCFEDQ